MKYGIFIVYKKEKEKAKIDLSNLNELKGSVESLVKNVKSEDIEKIKDLVKDGVDAERLKELVADGEENADEIKEKLGAIADKLPEMEGLKDQLGKLEGLKGLFGDKK